jgi:hypothetical protein
LLWYLPSSIASGYGANVGIYRAIESAIPHYTTKEVWQVAIIPLDILVLIAQLGGFAVLAGAFLFLKNHEWWGILNESELTDHVIDRC